VALDGTIEGASDIGMSGDEKASFRVKPSLLILSERGWLSLTPADFRRSVLERLSVRRFAVGDAIYRQGEQKGGLWAIVEGGVQFEIPGPQLIPGLAHIAIPGFWFGGAPLIGKTRRLLGAYATQASILATISLTDCRAVLKADPARWQWIALLANMNFDLAMGVVGDLMLHKPRQRVIATLLRLTGWRTGTYLRPHPSPVHISQQQLAQISNLSRTVVSGILRDLERRGLIGIRYRAVEVLDGDGLKTLLAET
jgi:CRP/FNR family cyclic AMP-dependent transcriptional regulator